MNPKSDKQRQKYVKPTLQTVDLVANEILEGSALGPCLLSDAACPPIAHAESP